MRTWRCASQRRHTKTHIRVPTMLSGCCMLRLCKTFVWSLFKLCGRGSFVGPPSWSGQLLAVALQLSAWIGILSSLHTWELQQVVLHRLCYTGLQVVLHRLCYTGCVQVYRLLHKLWYTGYVTQVVYRFTGCYTNCDTQVVLHRLCHRFTGCVTQV